jgi:predicted SnoaL-like aldol condensation-catalyzing enzyme
MFVAQASAQGLSQQRKKESVRALLKSLETRDTKPFRIINPKNFLQHDPRIEDGIEGFRRWAARLPSHTRVNTIRIFADGDYVIAQSEFNMAGPKIGLREGGQGAERSAETVFVGQRR